MTAAEILNWGRQLTKARPFTWEQRIAVNEVIANLYTVARVLEDSPECPSCECDSAKYTEAMREN